jgi:uncharacterized protein (TIGR03067 family)
LNKVTTVASLVLAAIAGVWMVSTPPLPSSAPIQKTAALPTDEERLQGSWDVVALEAEGRDVPLPAEMRDQAVTFRADTMRTRFAPPEDDGKLGVARFKLGASRAPKQIDVVVEGAHRSSGIYLLEKGTLTICLAPAGQVRPTAFKTTADSPAILFVLKPAENKG